MAMQTRWRMPPRELEREALERGLRVGETDLGEHGGGFDFGGFLVERSGAAASASVTWSPTVWTGLSAVIGSWNTMPKSPPRMSRIWPPMGSSWARSSWRPGLRRVGDGALDDAAGRLDDAHDRAGHDRLARAALADDAQHLAARHVEVDAVDGLHHALVGLEVGFEPADLDEVRALHDRLSSR